MIKEEEMFGLKKDGNSCPNGVIYFAAFAIPVIVLLTAMWLWGIFEISRRKYVWTVFSIFNQSFESADLFF